MKYSKEPLPTYAEYYALSPKERRNLFTTNFFRFKHKLPLIQVPPYEINYHKQFSKLLSQDK